MKADRQRLIDAYHEVERTRRLAEQRLRELDRAYSLASQALGRDLALEWFGLVPGQVLVYSTKQGYGMNIKTVRHRIFAQEIHAGSDDINKIVVRGPGMNAKGEKQRMWGRVTLYGPDFPRSERVVISTAEFVESHPPNSIKPTAE